MSTCGGRRSAWSTGVSNAGGGFEAVPMNQDHWAFSVLHQGLGCWGFGGDSGSSRCSLSDSLERSLRFQSYTSHLKLEAPACNLPSFQASPAPPHRIFRNLALRSISTPHCPVELLSPHSAEQLPSSLCPLPSSRPIPMLLPPRPFIFLFHQLPSWFTLQFSEASL